jgi:hypothetical protein
LRHGGVPPLRRGERAPPSAASGGRTRERPPERDHPKPRAGEDARRPEPATRPSASL